MKTALIGYTGFVGGNLNDQFAFDDVYNSRTIGEIAGREYDLVISAANRAEMWRINAEPEIDRAEIDAYIANISQAKIKKLVLISTVGVYADPNGADEDTAIDTEKLLPYGANRYYLEQYCREHFDTMVVRLPGLFGNGLKKNVIFDLLHDNNVEKIHADGSYQYYDLSTIYRDIQTALANDISVVNFATPSITTERVARDAFGQTFDNRPSGVVPARWDMHTKFGRLFGGDDMYMCSEDEEINAIRRFVEQEKHR